MMAHQEYNAFNEIHFILYITMDEGGGQKKRRSITDLLQKIISCDRPQTKYADQEGRRLQRKILIILFACHIAAFVQSLGYSIQHTAFPYLTKRLGVTPQVYGYIISFNAVLQLIGGLFCGRLSDIYGGRFTLVISFMTIGIGYLILAVSTNTMLLFVSRIPTFAAHALQSMYVIIADITYAEERADMIGKLGASHGLGMIVGSIVGGLITDKFGVRPTFIVAVVVVTICICITTTLIPADTKSIRMELDKSIDVTDSKLNTSMQKDPDKCLDERNLSHERRKKEEKTDEEVAGSFLSIKEFIEVAKVKPMMYLLAVKAIAAFPFGVLSAMFTLVLMDYYKLGPKENGMVLSYLGVVGMVTQGYIVGLLARHATDDTLILLSTVLMGIGFLFLIISESIYIFCVVAIPLTIGGSLIHIIITSLITKIVPKDQNGSALGLTLCTHATIRSVAPTIGGHLFQHIGFFSFGILGYVVNFILSTYLFFLGKTDLNVDKRT